MRITEKELTIKRGNSFKVSLQLTDSEWDTLGTPDSVTSELRQGTTYYDLDAEIDANTRSIIISAETDEWKTGNAYFDIKIVVDGFIYSLPASDNIIIQVIDGVTR